MKKSVLWKSLCAILVFACVPQALANSPSVTPADVNEISMTCVSHLMTLVTSTYQMKQMYKTPVINTKDDQAILEAFNELKKEASAIQSEQAQGKKPSKAQIEKIQSIFVKPSEIFKKAAPKEMDLCIDWITKATRECMAYSSDRAKLQSCADSAANKPEIKKSMNAFMSAAEKHFLVPRS